MNDIDSCLRSQASQAPRRPLTKDFTNSVMERSLANQSRFRDKIPGLNGIFAMKLQLKRTGLLLGVGGAILLGGSAYGVASWHGNNDGAAYGGVTVLNNGDTRFWVSSKGHCDTVKQYYEIKKGAPITPAQISDMVAGTCESTDIFALFPGVPINNTPMATIPGNATSTGSPTAVQTRYYTTDGMVKANDGKTITMVFSRKSGYATETFPVITNVKAFENGRPIRLSEIKVGSHVQLVMQTQATAKAIDDLSHNWQDADHDTLPGSSVYGIEKLQHAEYDVYAEGIEFTRLVPNPKDIQGMSYKDVSAFDENPAHLHEEYPL